MPDEALAADMYELTQEKCAAAGLPAYGVSNHAREGHACRHNLASWRGGDYFGIGPGAHGRVPRSRTGGDRGIAKPRHGSKALSVAATVCRKSVYCRPKTCMPKPYCWVCVWLRVCPCRGLRPQACRSTAPHCGPARRRPDCREPAQSGGDAGRTLVA